jgi:HK97 family phage prohead protease
VHRETKNAPVLPVTSTDDSTGSFEGYLAVFSNIDHNDDVIDHGAFTKTLAAARAVQKRNKSPFIYPLLWQHDQTEPIGGITDAYEDNRGLYIKGQYDLNTDLGQRAYSGAKMGYLPGLSIGYRTVKSAYGPEGVRHITELQLFEGSVVTLPANDSAMIMSVKARSSRKADMADSNDDFARQLECQVAVMALEAKASRIRQQVSDDVVAEQTKERQARWQTEQRAIRERRNLERAARVRGERVPDLRCDPEAYVIWLQRQRALPYIELARDLNEQNRRGSR